MGQKNTKTVVETTELDGNKSNSEFFNVDKNENKRLDYLSWDEYFMSVAFLSAQRSKDPRTQVGACIVNDENKIVGIGYNGMAVGCSDDVFPWRGEADHILQRKQLYVCHAELNAIMNKNASDIRNCRIYVGLFPCNECAKLVIQAGIKEVIYFSDKYGWTNEFKASRILLNFAGIKTRQYTSGQKRLVIDFESINSSGVVSQTTGNTDSQTPPTSTTDDRLNVENQMQQPVPENGVSRETTPAVI